MRILTSLDADQGENGHHDPALLASRSNLCVAVCPCVTVSCPSGTLLLASPVAVTGAATWNLVSLGSKKLRNPNCMDTLDSFFWIFV